MFATHHPLLRVVILRPVGCGHVFHNLPTSFDAASTKYSYATLPAWSHIINSQRMHRGSAYRNCVDTATPAVGADVDVVHVVFGGRTTVRHVHDPAIGTPVSAARSRI